MVKKFLNYWKENFKSAKDGFDYTMLIFGSLFLIVTAICKYGNFNNPTEEFITDAKLQKWGEIGAGLFFSVWCFLWLPFQRHKQTNEAWLAKMNLLTAENQKLKNEAENNNIKLETTCSLGLERSNTLHVLLTIKALNVGKRIVRIRRVAILLDSTVPILEGVTVGLVELTIGQKRAVVEIEGDDGMHEWQQVLNANPHFRVHEKDGEKCGRGYIELTSGRHIEFDFPLLPDDTWSKLGYYGPPKLL